MTGVQDFVFNKSSKLLIKFLLVLTTKSIPIIVLAIIVSKYTLSNKLAKIIRLSAKSEIFGTPMEVKTNKRRIFVSNPL